MSKTPQEYLESYQKLHDGSQGYLLDGTPVPAAGNLFNGSNFFKKLYNQFAAVISKYDSVRVLDYGCGKAEHLYKPVFKNGTLHQEFKGKIQTYYCYDPGYAVFKNPPPRGALFDIIICADVLEHVPEPYIEQTLFDIRSMLAPGGTVLFTIGGKLARKAFLDGENLHCSVLPMDQWLDMVMPTFKGCSVYLKYEGEHMNTIWMSPQYAAIAQ